MVENTIPFHYVCTLEEAASLINARQKFWVSNCGCREARGQCKRSRMDVCLMFSEAFQGTGSGRHEITKAEAGALLREAREKNLVARPFRNGARTDTDGICFCCDDCCGYFLDTTEVCDRGKFVAETDMELCNNCGECVEVCYFEARTMKGEELASETDKCYGCGLCVSACPEDCIDMVQR
jgi:ferredoxin